MPTSEAPKVTRSYCASPSIRVSSDKKRVTVQVSTDTLARDGMIVEPGAIRLDNYRQNPVVMWNHGMGNDGIPIGRAVDVMRVDGGIRATVEFDEDDYSQRIKEKVERGSINAVSMGWITEDMEGERVTKGEMTEFSFVSVPADPNALVVSRALEDKEALQKLVDERVKALLRKDAEHEDSSASDPGATQKGDAETTAPEPPTNEQDENPDPATAGSAPDDTDEEATAESSAESVPGDSDTTDAPTEVQRSGALTHSDVQALKELFAEAKRQRKQRARLLAKRKRGQA